MESKLSKDNNGELVIDLKLNKEEFYTLFTAFGTSCHADRAEEAGKFNARPLYVKDALEFYEDLVDLEERFNYNHLIEEKLIMGRKEIVYSFSPTQNRVKFEEALAHYQDGGTIQCRVLDENGYVVEVEHYHKSSGMEICLEFNEILNGHWFLY